MAMWRGLRFCAPCRRPQRVDQPFDHDLALNDTPKLFSQSDSATDSGPPSPVPPSPSPMLPPTPKDFFATPKKFFHASVTTPKSAAPQATPQKSPAPSQRGPRAAAAGGRKLATKSKPFWELQLNKEQAAAAAKRKEELEAAQTTPDVLSRSAVIRTPRKVPKPSWRRSPWSRNETPKAGALARASTVPPPVLTAAQSDYIEATAEARTHLVDAFVCATKSIRGHSPLVDYFMALGRCEAPVVTAVQLNDRQLQEFRTWMPLRQAAAIRLLTHNPSVTSVNLNGCALEDTAGPVLAEVVSASPSLTVLSVERNDLREPGLLAIVNALRGNTHLTELRINHQRMTVSTPIEEALHQMLHEGHNTTLCKLGLVIRNDIPRSRIHAALMRNTDAHRVARLEAMRREQGLPPRLSMAGGMRSGKTSGFKAVGLAALLAGEAAPRKRQLSGKLASFAAGLEEVIAPFDADQLVEELRSGRAPACAPDGTKCLNLNNDVKFAKCSAEQKTAVVRALASGAVQVVELANVQLGDGAAFAMAEVLGEPTQRIRSINLEGNLLASAGIEAIAAALANAPHLTELRLDHQVGGVCSAAAEMTLARAVDAHPALHKLSYTMRQLHARDLTQRATMRNRDKSRVQRQQTRRQLGAQQQQGMESCVTQVV